MPDRVRRNGKTFQPLSSERQRYPTTADLHGALVPNTRSHVISICESTSTSFSFEICYVFDGLTVWYGILFRGTSQSCFEAGSADGKELYVRLAMSKAKCIELDNKQAALA